MFRRFLRAVLILMVVLAILIVGGGIYARARVRASLPQLDGAATIDNLTADVRVDRNALDAPPFEYLVLRATPEPWRPEDSILTVLAMFNTLQGRQALFEQSHGALRDTLPEPMFRFLSTAGSDWDTPVVGNPIERPRIPGPDGFALRHLDARTSQAQ